MVDSCDAFKTYEKPGIDLLMYRTTCQEILFRQRYRQLLFDVVLPRKLDPMERGEVVSPSCVSSIMSICNFEHQIRLMLRRCFVRLNEQCYTVR